MAERGLQPQYLGPRSAESDESLDAIFDLLLSTQEAAEEEGGVTALRDSEERLEDIAWNAVVVGHPNRFEDVGEASQHANLLAHKLIQRGYLPAAALPFAPAMLVGLLWYLWSSQTVTHLDRDFAEGQCGAVVQLVGDIATHWSPPDNEIWYSTVAAFPNKIDENLAYLESVPWERVHREIKTKVNSLVRDAKKMLSQISKQYPAALPACAAWITGLLAVKNTYSPWQGSVPEDMHEKLTDAVWSLNADNEGRFYAYLMRGFESVRNRQPDELERWRWEQQSSQRNEE